MKKFLKRHQEILFLALALLFTALLVLYFTWGVRTLVVHLRRAVVPSAVGGENFRFDLEGARELLQLK